MLEQLAGDDCIEGRVVERERPLDVAPDRLDAASLGDGESLAVDVHSDNPVAFEKVHRDRAGPATEIEHLTSRPAHSSDE